MEMKTKNVQEILTKIDSLREEGMTTTGQVRILTELLLSYVDGQRGVSPVLEIILEKTEKTSKILEEIELSILHEN